MSVRLHDIAEEIRETYQPKPEENIPYIGLEHVEKASLHLSSIGSSQDI